MPQQTLRDNNDMTAVSGKDCNITSKTRFGALIKIELLASFYSPNQEISNLKVFHTLDTDS